jgi:ATP-binding cassette, subfamily B, bacterial PglK
MFKILDYKQKKTLIFLFAFSLIGMILETFGVGLVIPLIAIIADPNSFYSFNNFTKSLLTLELTYEELLIYSFVIILCFYFIKTIFLSFLVYFQSKFIYSLKENLSNKLYLNYLSKNYLFHLSKNSSELIRNITLEVMYFGFAMISLTNIIIEFLVFFGILLLLLLFEPMGTILILIFFIIISLVFFKIIKLRTKIWGEERQYRDGKILQNLQQGLGAIKDVILMAKERYFLKQFSIHNQRSKVLDITYNLFQNIPKIVLELLAVFALFAVVLISVLINEKDPIEIITFLSVFAAGSLRLLPSINRLINNFQTYRYYQPSVKILKDNIIDLKELNELKVKIDFSSEYKFKKLKITNLNYSYPESNVSLFNDLSLEVNKGDIIGIIGKSGSGKSTLINIIMGLLEPKMGHISINGLNMHDNVNSWQKKIGYVPQGIYLTDDTIEKNIAFGCFAENIDSDKVNKCLILSQLDELVNNLPEKSQTIVGERGAKLSGGQVQRIGIARALYNEAELLIFDEATNSLDSQTENEILNSINLLQNDRTILIVTHNEKSLKNCNRIYKLENGDLINIK